MSKVAGLLSTWPGRGLVAVIVALVVAVPVLAGRLGAAPTDAGVRTVAVARGSVSESVAVAGSLNPASTFRLSFGTAGRLADVMVKVGDAVTAGQALARLDEAELAIAVAQAEANLVSAEAKHAQTIEGASAEDVAIARNAVDSARRNLEDARRSSATGVAEAEGALRAVETDYRVAAATFASTRATLDAALDAYVAGIASVHGQVLELRDALEDILRPGDIRTARDQLNEADLSLTTAEDFIATALAPQRADLAGAHATVAAAIAAFDRAMTAGGGDAAALALESAQAAFEVAAAKLSTAVDAPSGELGSAQASLTSARETLSSPGSLPLSLLDSERDDLAAAQNALLEEEQRAPAIKALVTRATTDLDGVVALAADDHAQARTDLAEARDGSGSAVLSQENALRSAQLSLNKTAAGAKAYDIASAYASVLSAQAALESARSDLGGAVLKAPAAGVVTTVDGQTGEDVSAGGTANPFITIAQLTSLVLHGTVGEADVARLEVGQPARVVVDAVSSEPLMAGRISLIAPVATISQGVPVYGVDVLIERPHQAVRAGMSGTADVVLAEANDVLTVPNLAIRSIGGRRVVQVLKDGQAVPVQATFGVSNDSVTEVKSGLAEGDLVVLPQSRTTPSTTQQFGPGGGAAPGQGPRVITR